ELDAEALAQLRQRRELVRAWWDHRAALALEAAFEVHRRPVALEVARRRQDEVREAVQRRREERDRDDRLRVLGERAHVRVDSGLVAGDDEELDRLRIARFAVGGGAPGVPDAAAVRDRRQVEGPRAGFPGEPELLGRCSEMRAADAARAGPDQDSSLGRADPL